MIKNKNWELKDLNQQRNLENNMNLNLRKLIKLVNLVEIIMSH